MSVWTMSCTDGTLPSSSLRACTWLLLVSISSHPTADYINEYMEYYTNPNITTWPSELWPKNSLVDNC